MAAAKLNILVEQGADFERKLTFRDSLNALIDLTGNTFEGQIRKKANDPIIVASFTCVVLNQVTNKGEMKISLTNVQTSAIAITVQKFAERKLEKYAYDLERNIGGIKSRILEGIAEISPEVTE